MCLLVLKPAGKKIPKEYFERGFRTNSDGGGFAYAKDGKVIMRKPFWNVDDMWKECEPLMEDHTMIVHFRITTHGGSCAVNTHPFDAGGGWAMGHNGVISKANPETGESDTRAYVREFLAPITEYRPDFIQNPLAQKQMSEHIGHSKLAFLNGKGEYVIVNEGFGEWDGDIWYSNTGYRGPRRDKPTTTYYNTTTTFLRKIPPFWTKPEKPVVCKTREEAPTGNGRNTTSLTKSTATPGSGTDNDIGKTVDDAETQLVRGNVLEQLFQTEVIVFKDSNFRCCYCGSQIKDGKENVSLLNTDDSYCETCMQDCIMVHMPMYQIKD